MNRDDANAALVDAITHVAPNVDPTDIDGGEDLMEELDLDSIDLVGIVARIHDRAGVDIPESDYGELETFDSFVDYLTRQETE